MVNVRHTNNRPTKPDVPDDTGTGIRGQRLRENQAKLRALRRPGLRVVPADDHPRLSAELIRKHITHAPSGIKFRESGSIEWPNDRFTQRRIREGVVRVVEDRDRSEGERRGDANRPAREPHRETQPAGPQGHHVASRPGE